MNRRERKKEETRENIISCAIALFREKGLQQTSMEEIAEKADVSKGTLYNYFPQKESILVGYFQSYIADYAENFREDLAPLQGTEARLYKFLDFINEILAHNVDLGIIYMKYRLQTFFDSDPFDNPQRSGLEYFLVDIIAEGQKNKELRNDIPALVMARNFQFLIRSYLTALICTKEPYNMDTLKTQLISLFLNGAKE